MANFNFVAVNQSAIEMVKAEILKRGMVKSENAAKESSLTNIDMSVFGKDEVFRFTPELSETVYEVKMRNSTNVARVVFVATLDGSSKMFFPSTMRKAVQEAKPATIAGENVPLTGVTYIANREGFTREGKPTQFYEVCQKFPSDLSLYTALAKNQVAVIVKDRKVVTARSFNDPTRTQNQGVMNIEFALEGAERDALIKTLEEAASAAVNSVA